MKFETGNFKFRRRRAKAQVEGLNGIIFAETEFFDRTMRHIEQRREICIIAIAEQQAVSRHEPDELRKTLLDGVEIFKNVRVIEFQIVDDGNFRQVMDELAALVEKRRVVFVALDDEPLAVRETRALRKIIRDAADEKTRIQTVVLENPRQQRSRRGLAVRSRNNNRTFTANKKFLQQFRQRAVTQFVVETKFRFGIATRNSVANDNQIRLVRKIFFVVAV